MTLRAATGILVLLVVVVFAPTLGGAFVWDDEVLITSNARLHGDGAWVRALTDDFWNTSVPTDARRGYWRPVVKLSHAALLMAGGAAWPFHLVNGLLHLACVLLAFRWIHARLLSAGSGTDDAVRPALMAAALFAVHPSRYEVVGWVSCSTDLFMTLFTLLALWALERKRYAGAALLVALALLSKESVLMLPVAILADGVLRRRIEWRAVAAIGLGLMGPLVARAALGLQTPALSLSDPWITLFRSATALGVYHLRTACPFPLTVLPFEVGPSEGIARFGTVSILGGALAVAAWIAWGALARRSPTVRPFLADGLWWLVLLLPFLQVVPAPSITFASDRFLYLPLLGACALLGRALVSFPTRLLLLGATAAIAASAGALSLTLPAYASSLDFFGREFRLRPDSPIMGAAYAAELQRSGHQAARRALLRRLALQRTDLRTASWALGHLANATLALTADGDAPTLEALARFYDGILGGAPVPLQLGEDVFRVPPQTEVLLHQARIGLLDDIELFAATVALEQGHLEDALDRAQRLARAPTSRRLTLLARVHAAKGDLTGALGVLSGASSALRNSHLAMVLREAVQLPPEPVELCGRPNPCDPKALALRRRWVEVWHQLQLRVREDAAIDAFEPGPEKATLEVLALISRHHGDEALALLGRESLGEPLESQVRASLAARRSELETELALVTP